jgi:hypothetical protein
MMLASAAALGNASGQLGTNSFWTSAFGIAIVAGIFALIGHLIGRSNTKLQTKISAQIAAQTNEISERNVRLQTRLAANLKLAEMRQAWINSLRDDMAAFQAIGVTPAVDHAKAQEFYRLGTRIELFMNPHDKNYPQLQEALYAFLQAKSIEEKYAANPGYVDVCQAILKDEWDVLKNEIKAVTN